MEGEHICNPRNQEVKHREGLQIQVQPGLHNEFQVSLTYSVRPYLKKNPSQAWVHAYNLSTEEAKARRS